MQVDGGGTKQIIPQNDIQEDHAGDAAVIHCEINSMK